MKGRRSRSRLDRKGRRGPARLRRSCCAPAWRLSVPPRPVRSSSWPGTCFKTRAPLLEPGRERRFGGAPKGAGAALRDLRACVVSGAGCGSGARPGGQEADPAGLAGGCGRREPGRRLRQQVDGFEPCGTVSTRPLRVRAAACSRAWRPAARSAPTPRCHRPLLPRLSMSLPVVLPGSCCPVAGLSGRPQAGARAPRPPPPGAAAAPTTAALAPGCAAAPGAASLLQGYRRRGAGRAACTLFPPGRCRRGSGLRAAAARLLLSLGLLQLILGCCMVALNFKGTVAEQLPAR